MCSVIANLSKHHILFKLFIMVFFFTKYTF